LPIAEQIIAVGRNPVIGQSGRAEREHPSVPMRFHDDVVQRLTLRFWKRPGVLPVKVFVAAVLPAAPIKLIQYRASPVKARLRRDVTKESCSEG
jgi:hypothetical protein